MNGKVMVNDLVDQRSSSDDDVGSDDVSRFGEGIRYAYVPPISMKDE